MPSYTIESPFSGIVGKATTGVWADSSIPVAVTVTETYPQEDINKVIKKYKKNHWSTSVKDNLYLFYPPKVG